MGFKRVISLLIVVSFFFVSGNHPAKLTQAIIQPSFFQAQNTLQSHSSFFTENKGQWDPSILFVGNTSFGKVAFTKNAIYYQLIETSVSISDFVPNHGDVTVGSEKSQVSNYRSQVVKLTFVNPKSPQVNGAGLLSHYNNYFIGNDPKKWASYCHNYAKIEYMSVWEGIDLAYFFTPEGLKYEYYVDPQANIQDLQIKVEGGEITNHGTAIQISTNLGKIQDVNLKVYDQNTLQDIPSSFQIHNNIISFTGIPEVRQNTIVIDPLIWSTYFGGNEGDEAKDITIDTFFNAYIVGRSYSTDFPITSGTVQKEYSGGIDAFITKLNDKGSEIVWSTFLGGRSTDDAHKIMLDIKGNIVISGVTSSEEFPITKNAVQLTPGSIQEVFVTKINPSGSDLIFSTYLGGSAYECSEGLATDAEENVYICGTTYSRDFPTTTDSYQSTCQDEINGYITKINPSGTKLIYSSYLGGSGEDHIEGLALEKTGNVYVTGRTRSNDFPTSQNAYQSKPKGEFDVFVTKLNQTGTEIIFSTLLGGSKNEVAYDIVIDSYGHAYVCGSSSSADFPTGSAYAYNYRGQTDAFIARIDSTGSFLFFATYLGGSGFDVGVSIEIDINRNVIVSSRTNSFDFPTTVKNNQIAPKKDLDVVISKVDNSGKYLLYSIYLGGSSDDDSRGSVLDGNGNLYVTGETTSSDFPTTPGVFQSKFNGQADAFVTKLSLEMEENPADTSPPILKISSPKDNTETIESKILMQGKAYDNESGILTLTINGQNVAVDKDGSFEFSIFLSDGINKVEIIATNGVKLTTTKTLTINKKAPDKKGPTIMLYTPLPYEVVMDEHLLVKGKAIDKESGLEEVFVNKKPVPFDDKGVFETVVILEELENDIEIEARDKQGNESYLEIEVKCEQCFKKNYLIIELWVGKTSAFFDGKPYTLDVPPMVRFGRTQVPIRFIAEGLKATVNYDTKAQKIEIQYKTTSIILQIDNPEIVIKDFVDGAETVQRYNLELPPYIYKGRTMVPVRVISEAFRAKVEYGSSDRKITISMKR